MSIIFSLWTVVVMVMFLGIAIWAWSGKNKEKFDSAARIPLEDEFESSTDINERN